MTKRSMLSALRLTLGLLAAAAIGRQLAIQIQSGFSVVNFLSYFTNLSNLFAAVVLLAGFFRLALGRKPSVRNALIRYVAVVNMAVVGVVFTVLLRDVDLGSLLPWVNVVLHYIMPVGVVLEWVLGPPGTKLGVSHVLLCQVFPLLYLIYAMARGAITGWYPYPFLNPANVGGYAGVVPYAVGIAVAFLFAGWSLMALGNKLNSNASVASA